MAAISFRHSIRFHLLLGFVAMGIIIALLGGYGISQIDVSGRIVVETYDRPMMAINFARAASLDFSQMRMLRLRMQHDPELSGQLAPEYEGLLRDFRDDIRVAEQRLLTQRERDLANRLETLAADWSGRFSSGQPIDAPEERAADMAAAEIMHNFDMLIEYAAESSFVERQRAVSAMSTSRSFAFAATAAALLLALLIAGILSRRIVRPLNTAAHLADRIAGGTLDNPIVSNKQDETGLLLRSMGTMQRSIHIMVEREKAQKHSAETRLAEALEGAREGAVLLDADDRVVMANTQFRQFFPSIGAALVPGARFSVAISAVRIRAHDHDPGISLVLLLLEGSEFRIDDTTWVHVSRAPTREGGALLLIADITESKIREELLRAAKHDAEAASEAKSRFLANMSHELRTPLNAVIGFSEMISGQMMGPVGNKSYVDYANDIAQSGRHLLDIINSVLDLVKSQADRLTVEVETVRLDEVIESCARMVLPQCAKAGLTLASTEVASLQVLGEPAKLRQIFLNLLSNAIKFTGDGGSVSISAAEGAGGLAEIRVTDTGIGMSPEEIPLAMTPFGQVDSRLSRCYEGTGLGLPLTKVLVEAHGGRLEIESEPGRGTTASVFLPLAANANEPTQADISLLGVG